MRSLVAQQDEGRSPRLGETLDGSGGRRSALLLGASLLAYSVLPSAAQAANECGAPPPGGGTVTCTTAGNSYPNGIDYDPPGGLVADLTVVLNPGVVVNNPGSLTQPNGIEIGSSTLGVDLSLQGATNTQITTTAANHDAVDVVATDGTVDIDLDDVDTTLAGSRGIVASGRGTTGVTVDTVATLGDNADGISAEEGNFLSPGVPPVIGGTSVTANSVSTGGANSTGIIAFSENGDTVVDVGTVTTGGDFSTGILAIAAVGDVRVTSDSVTTDGANSVGIDAQIFPFPDEVVVGTVVVDSTAVDTAGDNADGIVASSPVSDVTVNSDMVITRGDDAAGISAFIIGQFISPGNYTYGPGDILIDSGTVFTQGADNSDGIVAIGADSVTIISDLVQTQGDASAGIYAQTYFDGAIVITSGTVATVGDTLAVDSGGAHGIEARANDGSITIDSSLVSTGFTGGATGLEAMGIRATSNTGAINITSDDVFTNGARAVGIFAQTGPGSTPPPPPPPPPPSDIAGPQQVAPVALPPDISITSTSVSTEGDGAGGILAETATGDIFIESASVETAGDTILGQPGVTASGAHGIEALTDSGSITIVSTVITTGGSNANGIVAESDSGAIDITSGAITAADGQGIEARNGTGDITIDSGSVTTIGGLFSDGIIAETDSGDIVIDSGTVSVGDGVGLFAITQSGDITITSDEVTVSGDITAGISASGDYYTGGDIDVVSGSVETTGRFADAISVSSRGEVSVQSTSIVTGGEGSRGIVAESDSGGVAIESGTIDTSGPSARGIKVNVYYEAGVVIESDSVTTLADNGDGIIVATLADTSTGDFAITSTSVSTRGDRSIGIYAYHAGSGDIVVTSGTVTTAGDTQDVPYGGSHGIELHANNGSVTVASTTVGTGGTGAFGILVTTNVGAINIISGTVTTGGDGAVGISAITGAGATEPELPQPPSIILPAPQVAPVAIPPDISITSTSVSTLGDNAIGISAATGDGDIYVESGSVATAGDDATGILAETKYGSITVDSGTVTTTGANAAGIEAAVTGGVLDKYAGGSILVTSGSVSTIGADSPGIHAVADVGDTEIFSNGTVTTSGANSDGIIADAANGFAFVQAAAVNVTGTGADAIVVTGATDNDVIVTGLVRSTNGFAIQADGATAEISTTAPGIIRGRIDLTDGADTLTNVGAFEAIGTSQFGAGADVFTNSGVTRSESGAAVLAGLEAFNSSGQVDMGDGAANDRLTVGNFNGTGGSNLVVDVDFDAGVADVLVTGVATGSTQIQVNAIGTTGAGFTSGGILVVDATAGTPSTAFSLAGGQTVSNGYVTAGLIFDAPNFNFLLVNAPNQPIFETVLVGGMTLDVWHQSADAVEYQLETARAPAGGGTGASNLLSNGRVGAWVQLYAGELEREATQSFTAGGTTTTFDVTYEQDFEGIQGGVDHQSGPVIFGLTAGLGRSDTLFEVTADSLEMESMNLGAYAAFASGNFYFNFQAKIDWIELETDPGPGLAAEFDATAYGVRAVAGYRFDLGDFFAEPSVSLSWVHTDIDDYQSGGATVTFDSVTSLRGTAGLRVGGAFATGGGGVVSPFLGVRVIEEFDGDATNQFLLGSTINLAEEGPGTHGEASAGLTFTSGSVEAFLRGELDFGGDVDGRALRAGVRLRF